MCLKWSSTSYVFTLPHGAVGPLRGEWRRAPHGSAVAGPQPTRWRAAPRRRRWWSAGTPRRTWRCAWRRRQGLRPPEAASCPCFDETAENYHPVLALKGVSTVNGKEVVKNVVWHGAMPSSKTNQRPWVGKEKIDKPPMRHVNKAFYSAPQRFLWLFKMP